MSDLDPEIARWRRALQAQGLRRQQIVELEDHLRSSVGLLCEAGVSAAAALAQSLAQLGDPGALAQEFHKETNMHPMSKLLGLAIAIAAILGTMELEGGHPIILLAVPPLVLVLGISLGGLVASHGPRRVRRMFAVALGLSRALPGEGDELRWICRRGHRLAYAGGLLQVVLGAMHICSVLDNPNMIGPGIAYVLIGLVHAVLVGELGFGTAERWVAGWESDVEAVA